MLVEELLTKLVYDEVPDAAFMVIRNQATVKDGKSVPDAEISADFKVLLETKIVPDSVDLEQVKKHCAQLGTEAHSKVVLLTPDFKDPTLRWEDEKRSNVVWRNFHFLTQVLDELFESEDHILSERNQFLLSELKVMFRDEGLLPVKDRVVVVAANSAYGRYIEQKGPKLRAYICQANRTFRAEKFAFYAKDAIQREVVTAEKVFEEFDLIAVLDGDVPDGMSGEDIAAIKDCYEVSGELVKWVKEIRSGTKGPQALLKAVIVSAPGAEGTTTLENTIKNNLENSITQRRYAYTQGQRYTSLKKAPKLCEKRFGHHITLR